MPSFAGSAGSGLEYLRGNLNATIGRIDVTDPAYGAVGDGVTDDSAAFAAAATAAKVAGRTMPLSLCGDAAGSVTIYVPPGDYLITNPGAMLGDETMSAKVNGLAWEGAGPTISNIVFQPATAGTLCTNDYWLGLRFSNLGFWAATAGSTFLFTNTTHAAQRYHFHNCFFKAWKYVCRLEGSNNNSEYAFFNCHSANTEATGAFFYVGTSNTSDQFLNYWFYGCTHWSTSAPFIDAAKGGNFHIFGLDVSDYGTALAAFGPVFALRGTSHSQGVCTFNAHSVRVEAKNVDAALLYSEWPQGSVAFHSVDWTSQVGGYTYNNIISIKYVNVSGPTYAFRDSTLAGGVLVEFASTDWQSLKRIVFQDCTWKQKNSPSDVVTYTLPGTNPGATPPVEFRGCRGVDRMDTQSDVAPAAVWDATIGYRGQELQSITRRTVSARYAAGVPSNGQTPRLILPVGAIITAVEVLAPAGGSAEGDGGSWALATTEVSPTTISTLTVSGAMSAGFRVLNDLTTPFYCDTVLKATVEWTPTNVSATNSRALLMIHGYW